MKITLLSICLFLFSSAFTQHPIIGKLWIGDVENYMQIDSLGVRVQYNYEYKGKYNLGTNSYKYTLSGDTLHLVEALNNSGKHDFLIITLSNEDLKLIPITRYLWTLANPRYMVAEKLVRYLRDLPKKVELKPAGPMEIHFDTPGGEINIFKRK